MKRCSLAQLNFVWKTINSVPLKLTEESYWINDVRHS